MWLILVLLPLRFFTNTASLSSISLCFTNTTPLWLPSLTGSILYWTKHTSAPSPLPKPSLPTSKASTEAKSGRWFTGACRVSIFQTPDRYYIYSICSSICIFTNSCKYHTEGRCFHPVGINFFS